MRIAIVNDVRLAVEAVRRVVLSEPEHQVAWVAQDGQEAVERCRADRPDLILMDLIMPRVNGVEATRRIMAASPCAIVVVTASVNDHASLVFQAMGAGALDAVNTPVLADPNALDGARALLAKIETIRKLIGAANGRKPSSLRNGTSRPLLRSAECLVALGASAGGPAALGLLLGQLPADFGAPVVVVQHVDSQFAPALATWLGSQTPLKVRLAREGDRPEAGTVLLAGRDRHLVFASSNRLAYARQPEDCSYRPSIDVFFKSAAQFWRGEIVAALLTGMGRDGAEGLKELRAAGHYTIAQDRASCAVFGMPKAAAELGAASEILALDKIGRSLRNRAATRTELHG